jgi:hypothetical protein
MLTHYGRREIRAELNKRQRGARAMRPVWLPWTRRRGWSPMRPDTRTTAPRGVTRERPGSGYFESA